MSADCEREVRLELTKRIKDCRNQLDSLGHSRETSTNQSRYLLDLALQFQDIASKALNTNYSSNAIFEASPSLKLATLVRNREEIFAEQVAAVGHTLDFDAQIDDGASQKLLPDRTTQGLKLTVRELPDHPDVADILVEQDSQVEVWKPDYPILVWLKDLHRSSRGFELGTFQASILPSAMKVQSKNWESLAQGYVSDIICLVHEFITALLREICSDERVRDTLLPVLFDALMIRYNRSLKHAKLILKVERAEAPATLDNSFATTLYKRCVCHSAT